MKKMSRITCQSIFLMSLILIAFTTIAKPSPPHLKKMMLADPINLCATNVQKGYTLKAPNMLCSDSNTQEVMFEIDGVGVTTGQYLLKAGSTPLLAEYNDGSMKMQLNLVLTTDLTKEYFIEIIGTDKSVGSPTGAGFTAALNNCGTTNANGWTFYNTFTMTVTGLDGNAGQVHTFTNPQNNKHTIQIGNGANTWQQTLGSGLWFDNANSQGGTATIVGDMQVELTPFSCCSPKCIPFEIIKKE
jgi:hypothetical protein